MSWGTAVVEWTFPRDGLIDVKILPKHCITKVNRLPSIKMNRLYVCLGLVPRTWATPKLYLIRLVTGAMAPGTPLWTMVEFELNLSWICMWKMLGQIVPNIFSPNGGFYGCFNTPLEHTPKPLPTGYKGTPFIVGSEDCPGCALGVWGCVVTSLDGSMVVDHLFCAHCCFWKKINPLIPGSGIHWTLFQPKGHKS